MTTHSLGEASPREFLQINAVAVNKVDGTLYASGLYEYQNKVLRNKIARWDKTSWVTLAYPLGPVNALAIDSERGILYAAGQFDRLDGKNFSNIAKYERGTWNALGAGVNAPVEALELDDKGHLYAGGIFDFAGGLYSKGIAKWNGENWQSIGNGLSGAVKSINYDDSSGYLYAVRKVETTDNSMLGKLAVWDGTVWADSELLVDRDVNTLALDETSRKLFVGGSIVAGGSFVDEWDLKEKKWSTLFNDSDARVHSLNFERKSQHLLVAGSKLKDSQHSKGRFISVQQWNGTNKSWESLDITFNKETEIVASDGHGAIYAASSSADAVYQLRAGLTQVESYEVRNDSGSGDIHLVYSQLEGRGLSYVKFDGENFVWSEGTPLGSRSVVKHFSIAYDANSGNGIVLWLDVDRSMLMSRNFSSANGLENETQERPTILNGPFWVSLNADNNLWTTFSISPLWQYLKSSFQRQQR